MACTEPLLVGNASSTNSPWLSGFTRTSNPPVAEISCNLERIVDQAQKGARLHAGLLGRRPRCFLGISLHKASIDGERRRLKRSILDCSYSSGVSCSSGPPCLIGSYSLSRRSEDALRLSRRCGRGPLGKELVRSVFRMMGLSRGGSVQSERQLIGVRIRSGELQYPGCFTAVRCLVLEQSSSGSKTQNEIFKALSKTRRK
jgi:hypothetical protein